MLTCHRFDRNKLENIIAEASRKPENAQVRVQVRYLGSYLTQQTPRARSIVVEKDYIDRHYLEEFVGYYANKLNPPPPKATRLHFFAEEITDEILWEWIEKATEGPDSWSQIRDRLEKSYLGYSVIRPLPSAPLGRTVLRPYPWDPSVRERRWFGPAASKHNVHLAGFSLAVEGLPFQQQEQAVGACATAALWSCLARVVRADGGRPPTPFAVTTAATRYLLQERDFPAVRGLDRSQMLAACREFGYKPHVLNPRGERGHFELAVKCYVRSGIPVILRIYPDKESIEDGHAVTVAGFREDDALEPAPDVEIPVKGVVLRAKGMSRLYLHDDQLGPYARARWEYEDGDPRLRYLLREPGFDEFNDKPMYISEAIVPHYPKLRLTAGDLIRFAGQLLQPVRYVAGPKIRDSLSVDLWFALGGDYLEDVLLSGMEPRHIRKFILESRISRYVGVVRFFANDEPFVDVLYDTTDIRRDADPWAGILAIVPSAEDYAPAFLDFCRQYGIQAIVAGAS